ncbi:MAG: hotdog fold thioesterase [Syntrophomonadaceae bacterium]|jgi:uncharacterized protein (TIGR00369 family)|nr:hotdog fold thioesterase [Syntrophomonadaceae bacterium]
MTEFSPQPFSHTIGELLGIKNTEYTKERVVCVMEVGQRHLQPFGLMHGGVSGVIAETVASLGSLQFIDQTISNIVGIELNMNHIRSAYPGNVLTAVGQPVHAGRKILVWEIRIYNEEEKLVCSSRCTIAVVDKPKTGAV